MGMKRIAPKDNEDTDKIHEDYCGDYGCTLGTIMFALYVADREKENEKNRS
jgi:hypothetical protein